jgi:uncharacterized protein (TIGR00645 family)
MRNILSLAVGLLFGVGLCVSGMSNPDKVLGFLDLAGAWDPSLAFVMGGAVIIGFLAFGLAKRRQRDLLGAPIELPQQSAIDPALVYGSLVFGMGWGLAGICPGPAIVDVGFFEPGAFVFVAPIFAGQRSHSARSNKTPDKRRLEGERGLLQMIERALEKLLFSSRWLLAPFYFALALGLIGLLIKAGERLYDLARGLLTLSESGMILGVLSIIDLTLTASLVVIIIFSGYVNFVSRIEESEHSDWPQWMASVDFSELKLKLMASIVAITAIKLLESFMDIDQESDRDLWWLTGLHVTFVVSALLLAVADRIGHRPTTGEPN